jgi:HlyD family secretion protein
LGRTAAIAIAAAILAAAGVYFWHASVQPPVGKELTASGTLTAIGVVPVRAIISGEVKEVTVDFNTPVQRGQVLARLSASSAARGPQPQTEDERELIRAPVDGTIVLRNITAGQTIEAGTQAPALFAIAPDLREMQIEATVSAAEVRLLRVGMPASFAVEAFPRRTFSGEVQQIRKSAAKGRSPTYMVVLAAANPELVLLPGMTARVRIALDAAR